MWRLADPVDDDGGNPAGPIIGIPLQRLLYGNVLEALSTGAFGVGLERSDQGQVMLAEYARLNLKSMKGKLSPDEAQSRQELQAIFGASD